MQFLVTLVEERVTYATALLSGVVVVVVVVVVRLSHFHLLLNRCTDFFQIWCGGTPGGCLPSLFKSGCYPYFLGNYG